MFNWLWIIVFDCDIDVVFLLFNLSLRTGEGHVALPWCHKWHLTKIHDFPFILKTVDIYRDTFNTLQYLSLKTGSESLQTQKS